MRKVTYAKLHATIFIPDVGTLKDTLPSKDKTIAGFEMFEMDNGALLLTWSDKQGRKREAVIGAANIQVHLREYEEPKAKK